MTRARLHHWDGIKENTIITIVGRKNSGKSYMVRRVIYSGQFPRVFVLDTNGEYGDSPDDAGHPWIITNDVKAGARKMVEVQNRPEFRVSLRDADTEQLVNLIDVAFEIPDTLLVVEETHMYIRGGYMPVPISRMVRMGRHKAISQIYVAQRPTGLARDMTAQSDFIVSFKQGEAKDIKWLGDVAGDGAEDVADLPRYKVRVWSMGDDDSKLPLPILEQSYRKPKNQLDFHREM